MRLLLIRNLCSLLIVIFFAQPMRGQGRQVVEDMRKVLAGRNFTALQSHIDNLAGANWECLRDLTHDFREGVLVFGYVVKDKDNPDMGTEFTFRVNLVTTKTRIVYYQLSERKYKKVLEDWKPYYQLMDEFKDSTAYKSLKSSFREIFHAELNESELFLTNFVYGAHCGFVGTDPEERKQIDDFVSKRNKAHLVKWLQSTNTEKQVYAVDGLYQLKKFGMKLTEDELKMIRFVTGKKGSLCVCGGCIVRNEEIHDALMEFEF